MDIKEGQILYELDIDCRTPFKRIAEKYGMHTQTVISSVERMQKKGILKGYTITTNMYPLGYITHNVFIQFSGMTPKEMEHFTSCIQDIPSITFGILLLGSYNLMLSIKSKSFFDLEEILQHIESLFGHLILRIDMCPRLKSIYLPRKYLLKQTPSQIPIIYSEGKGDPLELSPFDHALLCELSKDARQNVVQIANALDCTQKTVREHMQRLQREQIIKRFIPIIDISLLGYTWFIGLLKLHKKDKKSLERLEQLVTQHPNITFMTDGRGRWDLIIDLHVQHPLDCNTIMGKIRSILKEDIAEEQVVTVLRRLKQGFVHQGL